MNSSKEDVDKLDVMATNLKTGKEDEAESDDIQNLSNTDGEVKRGPGCPKKIKRKTGQT